MSIIMPENLHKLKISGTNIRKEILKEHSKLQAMKIAAWAEKWQQRIKALVNLMVNDEYRVVQRVARVISHIAERRPVLITPYLPLLVSSMENKNAPVAAKRNVVRVLQYVEIPPTLQGPVMKICFDFLSDPKETVAVKCFSMTVLAGLSKQFPDIRNELRLLIDEQWENATAGFKARARKMQLR